MKNWTMIAGGIMVVVASHLVAGCSADVPEEKVGSAPAALGATLTIGSEEVALADLSAEHVRDATAKVEVIDDQRMRFDGDTTVTFSSLSQQGDLVSAEGFVERGEQRQAFRLQRFDTTGLRPAAPTGVGPRAIPAGVYYVGAAVVGLVSIELTILCIRAHDSAIADCVYYRQRRPNDICTPSSTIGVSGPTADGENFTSYGSFGCSYQCQCRAAPEAVVVDAGK